MIKFLRPVLDDDFVDVESQMRYCFIGGSKPPPPPTNTTTSQTSEFPLSMLSVLKATPNRTFLAAGYAA